MRAGIVSAIEHTFTPSAGEPMSNIVFSRDWREHNNGPAGVNARHAAEALKTGRREGWTGGTNEVILATKQIEGEKPLQLMIFATNLPPQAGTTQVVFAWRIYDGDPSWRPTEVFAEALARFGFEIQLGKGVVGRFIARELVESTEGELPIRVLNHHGSPPIYAQLDNRRVGPIKCWWAFAVDEAAYAEDVRRRK